MNEIVFSDRRLLVAELYLKGHSRDRIAATLGVAQGTVSADLSAVRAMWAETLKEKLEDLKAEELARLQQVERFAWEAFQVKRHPLHLRTLVKCIELRVKMLGLMNPLNLTLGIPWDEIAKAAIRPVPDPIEEELRCLG